MPETRDKKKDHALWMSCAMNTHFEMASVAYKTGLYLFTFWLYGPSHTSNGQKKINRKNIYTFLVDWKGSSTNTKPKEKIG